MHVPKVMEIKAIISESKTVKTFIFDWKTNDILPGQFMMVWNFKDEKPMAPSMIDPINDKIAISVKKVGPFTEALHKMEAGDKLGLRGPYGRGFEIAGSRVLVVGGGIGISPLTAFTEKATRSGVEVDLISSATTKDELLFLDRMKGITANLMHCTDDGTYGFCGFGTELAEELLESDHYDMLVCCGPEVMMKKLVDLADEFKLPAQFSLERYMKCATGICGQCCVDNVGWRICKEGPVFWRDEIRLITEFGKYRRDAAGRKQSVH